VPSRRREEEDDYHFEVSVKEQRSGQYIEWWARCTSTALGAMDAASLSTVLGMTVTEIEQVSAPLSFAFASPPPALLARR